MARIEDGQSAANLVAVDPAQRALRASLRPMEVSGWYSLGAKSGLVTGVAANGALFSLRNLSANLLVVRRVGVGFVTTTAFTAAQAVDYGLTIARAFTASDTGGTAVAITGNNLKARTSLASPLSVDCRIATTAALGAGTKTLDANSIGVVAGWAGAVGAGISPTPNNLLQHDPGDHPVVLAQNEGLNILNLTAMGAAGVGFFYVNLEFAEAVSY